ncbi:MAG: 23S rRNA (guanosine(2251)-2'-O)-methyltransferase RlmB [Acidimicrobiia bacterium]
MEGLQAVRELLLAGRRDVGEVWVASDVANRGPIADLVELANDLRVRVVRVSGPKLAGSARSEAPQGVLARCAPLPEADLEELARRGVGTAPAPFLVALDGVTDPGNLGAVLRSAECAGATGVVLPRHGSVLVTPTVAKAAAGAIEHLPIALVPGLPNALARLRAAGVWVVGLDESASVPVRDLALSAEPVCLVLGAEGRGLAPLVRRRCDMLVSIPMVGRLGALNVAAAAAIALYEVSCHRSADDGNGPEGLAVPPGPARNEARRVDRAKPPRDA